MSLGVTNMSSMFDLADSFNGNLSGWNVSGVTDMSDMFHLADSFNGNLSSWNVSGVTDMSDMFHSAIAFNGNLSSWDVSGVTDMDHMFDTAHSFNGDISDWNVSGVTDVNYMFSSAHSFNGNLSGWNVSGVTDMGHMFSDATSFNGDISGWNVSGVTDMRGMFDRAPSFNGNISRWDVSGVTYMQTMFYGATSFNGNISSWNVSGVTLMSDMFHGATSFNGNISSWTVSGVTDMSRMFEGATSFDGDLSSWNVSGVTDMSYMFFGATDFNGDLSSWNVSGVTNMNLMFNGATSFNQNLGNWYIVLDETAIDLADAGNTIGSISAQNSVLDGHSPVYGLGSDSDSQKFAISGNDLQVRPGEDYSSGTYDVIITATGAGLFGTSNQRTVGVTVTDTTPSDTTPPTLALIGLDPETITVGASYTDAGATCTDDVDGAIAPTSSGTVDASQAGTYTVTYSCRDAAGNDATPVEREVIVEAAPAPDTTPPTLALIGSDSETITVGASYTDAGATCTDTVDGAIAPTSSGTVDASQAGTYTLTYSCQDAAGNSAPDVSRTVTVEAAPAPDTTPPTLALIGSDPETITVGASYTDAGATCTDDVDGAITPTSSGTVDASQAGTYTVTYSCRDAAGNDATPVEREVIVEAAPVSDTTPPTLALIGSDPETITVGASYTDAGATCTDTVDGAITPTSSGTVDASQAGTYTVTYSCRDAAGNDATPVEREVIVEAAPVSDTTPPTLALIGPDSETITVGASYTDAGATCTDTVDGTITPTSSGTVDASQAGTYTLTYSCQDAAGNGAPDVSRIVTVQAASDTIKSYEVLGLTSAGSIVDGGSLELGGPHDIAIFKSGTRTYAAVASYFDSGVQILDVTDPDNITATDQITDGGNLELAGARGITIFKSGTHTYAAVASYTDDGVQILDVTDPDNITAADQITDGGNLALNGARGITTFKSGTHTYAAVTSTFDDSVQILNVTDPDNITATDQIRNSAGLELNDPRDITTFKSGTNTYAAVASYTDDGVQILDVTDPDNITATDQITDDYSLNLAGAAGIATFKSGTHTYAAVTSYFDDGVQILDVTDPDNITAASRITDDGNLELAGARGITIFKSGTYTYAAVASSRDNGVQILDVTDPNNITATSQITDGGNLVLATPYDLISFELNEDIYIAVASNTDNGVQILKVDRELPALDTTKPDLERIGPATLTITVGDTYDDQGATCTDDVDGTITPTSSGTVDASQAGTYTVTYSCRDAAGNDATPVEREVIVEAAPVSDTTPPTLALIGPDPETITVGASYTDAGATCEDAVDGAITPTSSGTVDASQAGTYTVTYSCQDAAGNSAPDMSRTVTVEAAPAPDTTPPTLALIGPDSETITVGASYTDAGATCTDTVDGAITPTSSGTVDASQAGTYTVTYSCQDAAGNSAPDMSRTVTVEAAPAPDTTPPTLALIGPDSETITVGASYTDAGATCTDTVDGAITPTSRAPSMPARQEPTP